MMFLCGLPRLSVGLAITDEQLEDVIVVVVAVEVAFVVVEPTLLVANSKVIFVRFLEGDVCGECSVVILSTKFGRCHLKSKRAEFSSTLELLFVVVVVTTDNCSADVAPLQSAVFMAYCSSSIKIFLEFFMFCLIYK